jgi:hypothetical protein
VTDGIIDSNANPESYALRSIQWHNSRRLPNSYGGGNPRSMARHVQRDRWSRLVGTCSELIEGVDRIAGPAHAVYFATYEGVNQLMGGNQAGVHHPLAAGMLSEDLCFCDMTNVDSYKWSMRYDCE